MGTVVSWVARLNERRASQNTEYKTVLQACMYVCIIDEFYDNYRLTGFVRMYRGCTLL